MTSFAVRLTALLCMFFDHAVLALLPPRAALRAPGALSFPLYCFLLVQGFTHTRSRRHYALRLFAVAAACEIPFDLLHYGVPFCAAEQNAAFSLLLCLFMLSARERLSGCGRAVRAAVPAACCILSMLLRLSFGWLGPALVFAFSCAKGRRRPSAFFALALPLFYSLFLALAGVDPAWVRASLAAPLSALPVLLYNGRPGPRGRLVTFAFCAAVPLHLAALVCLRSLRLIPPWVF